MQATAVSITGTRDTHYHLTFRFLDGGPPIEVDSNKTADEISNFRSRYLNELYRARRMLGPAQPECTETEAFRFIDTVHRLGCELLFKLAGEKLPELSNRLIDQLKLSMTIEPPGNLAPTVEVDA